MRLQRGEMPVIPCPGDMFFDASTLSIYVIAGDGWHKVDTDYTFDAEGETNLAETFFELAFRQPGHRNLQPPSNKENKS